MVQVGGVLGDSSESSLVLLDELASGTNSAEGVALCWAIIEHLLMTHATVVMATHHTPLTRMALIYPMIRK